MMFWSAFAGEHFGYCFWGFTCLVHHRVSVVYLRLFDSTDRFAMSLSFAAFSPPSRATPQPKLSFFSTACDLCTVQLPHGSQPKLALPPIVLCPPEHSPFCSNTTSPYTTLQTQAASQHSTAFSSRLKCSNVHLCSRTGVKHFNTSRLQQPAQPPPPATGVGTPLPP